MRDIRVRWILAAFGLIVFRMLLPAEWVEWGYSRGVFVLFRWAWDYTLGWLPFPILPLLVLGLLVWLGVKIFFFVKKAKARPIWENVREALLGLGGFAGMGLSLFLLLWGFHYGRLPLERQLSLEVLPLDSAAICDEARFYTQKVTELRAELAWPDTGTPRTVKTDAEIETHLRACLYQALRDLGYPTPGKARCRILPGGTLLHLGISGIYMPFSGEGHVDGGMHRLELPYTLAHELGHALGIPGEGDCNLLGALACERSDDPVVRYGGALEHWRTVMGELYAVAPGVFKEIKAQMPTEIRRDLRELRASVARYPDWFPEVSQQVNNTYLKVQGVREGIKSYDRAVGLMRAMRLAGLAGGR